MPQWLLHNTNFLLLWAAYFISAAGDNFNDLGQLSLLNVMKTDDATRPRALMMFGLFLPYVVLGPLAGWCADRFSRKWTMIVADLGRACIVVNFAVVIPYFMAAGLGSYSVMFTQMMLGLLAAFFSPARQALLPTLVRDSQLVRANGMISAVAPVGAMLGFLAGGFIVDHAGAVWNFRINCVGYFISASLVLAILVPRHHAAIVAPARQSSIFGPLAEGFAYVWRHQRVWQMILLGSLFWGASGVVFSCLPAVVKELVSTDYADIGVYQALPAVGMVIGAALMTLLGPAFGVQLATLSGLLLAAAGLLALAIAFVLHLSGTTAMICLLVVGLGGSVLLVTIMASLQRFVPDTRRGRVFGVSDMTTMAAMVLATGALGLNPIEHLDRYVPLILSVTTFGLLVALWMAWRLYRRGAWLPPDVWVIWHFVRFYSGAWLRTKRIGLCRIPHHGPAILVSNHTCGIDPMAILAATPHRMVYFVVAEEYCRIPIVGWFTRRGGCVPVNRQSPRKSFFRNTLQVLKSGGCLGVFPQGTYAAPGQVPPEPKPGAAALALRTGAPLIPCHISGTKYSRSPLAAFFLRHKVRIRFGDPIDLSDFRGRERAPDAPQLVTARIMQKIEELAPQAEDDAA